MDIPTCPQIPPEGTRTLPTRACKNKKRPNPVPEIVPKRKRAPPRRITFEYVPPPKDLKPILRAARRVSRCAQKTLVRSKERKKKMLCFNEAAKKIIPITPRPEKEPGVVHMPLSPEKQTVRALPHLAIDPIENGDLSSSKANGCEAIDFDVFCEQIGDLPFDNPGKSGEKGKKDRRRSARRSETYRRSWLVSASSSSSQSSTPVLPESTSSSDASTPTTQDLVTRRRRKSFVAANERISMWSTDKPTKRKAQPDDTENSIPEEEIEKPPPNQKLFSIFDSKAAPKEEKVKNDRRKSRIVEKVGKNEEKEDRRRSRGGELKARKGKEVKKRKVDIEVVLLDEGEERETVKPTRPPSPTEYSTKNLERDYAPFTTLQNIGFPPSTPEPSPLPLRDLTFPSIPNPTVPLSLLSQPPSPLPLKTLERLSEAKKEQKLSKLAAGYKEYPIEKWFDAFEEKSNEDLPWTERYRPRGIGEFCGIQGKGEELREWVKEWKDRIMVARRNAMRRKAENRPLSDSAKKRKSMKSKRSASDSESDWEDDDALCNLFIIHGPNGTGKSALVSAVAEQLDVKVIELNSSERRTQKYVQNRLSGATHTHRVTQTDPSGLRSFFSSPKATTVPTVTRENSGGSISLILFDEADIVFSDEDGYWSAVRNFVAESRVPIVITCQDLGRCEISGELARKIEMPRASGDDVVPFLQTLCLSSCSLLLPASWLRQVYNHFTGDLRKILNHLQFHCSTSPLNLPSLTSLPHPFSAAAQPTAELKSYMDAFPKSSASFNFRGRLLDGLQDAIGEDSPEQFEMCSQLPLEQDFTDIKVVLDGLSLSQKQLGLASLEELADYVGYVSVIGCNEMVNKKQAQTRREWMHYFSRTGVDPAGVVQEHFVKSRFGADTY